MGQSLYLSRARYLEALKRQRERIANGLPFVAVDSDTVGDKYTHASWGLCARDLAAWPDAEDNLFPEQMPARVSPKYRKPPCKCPMDDRKGEQGGNGCFSKCAIFTSRSIRPRHRAEALARYDAALAKASSNA